MRYELIEEAKKIYKFFKPLRAEFAQGLSKQYRAQIFCKFECRNLTGSFKERGALNALLDFKNRTKIVTASAGNHALAVSYYAKSLGHQCVVVCPKNASVAKVAKIKSLGAKVFLHGDDFKGAFLFAKELLKNKNAHFIHPFDQESVVAGQGTLGLEILNELPEIKTVVAPVGGGGLIAGLALAIKKKKPAVKIVGVRSDWVKEKTGLNLSSLADGIAVKEIGDLNKPIIDSLVDDIIYVSEEEIAEAILAFLDLEKTLVEGAGAVSLIPIVRGFLKRRDFPACILVCGSNIDISVLSRLILRKLRQSKRLVKIMVAVPDKPGMLGLAAGTIGSEGGQIIQTYHDRLDSPTPNSVGISFLVEVFDLNHARRIVGKLKALFRIVKLLGETTPGLEH
ncbi:MAG: pyridoxal-phosphate dependent enzyme [Deltaproteobacteria bacterium]|nr:pyridoxal-phosphate dependent enzyme [Deltaproteobacteria bacterium]